MDRRTRIIAIIAVAGVVAVAAAFTIAYWPSDDSRTLAYGFNVKDYGAVGDGIADDGPAVVEAMQAAAGDVVLFPAGVYYIAHPSSLPKGWRSLDLHGEDQGVGFDKQSWVKLWWSYPNGGVKKAWDYVLIEP